MAEKFYPINLAVENKNCFVIGGGNVAFRKICGLLDANANVTVISPEICQEIINLSQIYKISLIQQNFSTNLISNPFLLIAATNDEIVNKSVVDFADKNNLLVNSVTEPFGNFTLPSKFSRGNLLFTVSSGNSSPAFSKFVREMLETEFDDNFSNALNFIADFRKNLKNIIPDSKSRIIFWRKVFKPELWSIIKNGDVVKLKKYLEDNL